MLGTAMNLDWYDGGLLGPNLASTSGEVIDGEAIIMNHDTGVYFNCAGCGAMIWQAVTAVRSLEEIVDYLAKCYARDRADLIADVAGFIDALKEHDLIETASAEQRNALLESTPGEAYCKPVLEAHTDLADLLLLDPVHVAPMASWPSPSDP
jgi:Coenzyme PQQ synthesis protein D (PqqD)